MSDAKSSLKQVVQRPPSFGQTVRAVAWSFFGVRRSSDYEQDVQKLNPVHVIVTGVVLAGLFVVAVYFFVRWVVQSGVAT